MRVARSLEVLRDQINKLAPNRDKSSDGTIGDAAHRARKSDHNPDQFGVVRALDITNDPSHGVNAHDMARALVASRDPRIKYVISDGQIANANEGFRWKQYNGSNPHNKHFHVSVVGSDLADSTEPWKGVALSETRSGGDAPIGWPTLRFGDNGDTVEKLQKLIGVKADGDFGKDTLAAVKQFQRKNELLADGIVGPATWDKLLHSALKRKAS